MENPKMDSQNKSTTKNIIDFRLSHGYPSQTMGFLISAAVVLKLDPITTLVSDPLHVLMLQHGGYSALCHNVGRLLWIRNTI
jgi:hypothetical protein